MNQATHFSIGKRKIGPGRPTFIVAEMSGNHNQSLKRAFKIVAAAAAAGVDAIKLQTYTADTMTIDSANKYFQVKVNDAWKGRTLYQLYQQAYTPWQWQKMIKQHAEQLGLVFFSTPFDETAVDFLEKLRVPLYKIASFEIGDLELLKKVGKTKKPVILSRGMAAREEIKLAIKTLKQVGAPQVAVLHCVSSYPAKPEEMNLTTIPDLAKKFKTVCGLSDHSLGIAASIAAVALGASIIEKHVTLKRSEGGPDAAFSLEPKELKELVTAIRQTEQALGKPTYSVGKQESKSRVFRRSLFAVRDINKGEEFTKNNLRSIRPGFGLAAKYLEKILGKKSSVAIKRGTPLAWKLVAK